MGKADISVRLINDLKEKSKTPGLNRVSRFKCTQGHDFNAYEKPITRARRSNVTVRNMAITNFTNGIYLYSSSSNALSGNNVTNNGYGNVANNYAVGIGILLDSSDNNILSDNNVTNSGGDGIALGDYSSSNNLSGNNVTASDFEGIDLSSSNGNNLSGNNVAASNNYGIPLTTSSYNTLSGNNVTNNTDGIYLGGSHNDTLSGNNVTANSEYGIGLGYSYNNTLSGNNVANNGMGIALARARGLGYSSSNFISHNSFLNNSIQILTEGSNNTWDDDFPFGGNFWSDYNGSDPNHDGIGDLNYTIDAINVDRYPLMGTFNRFSTSSEQSVETICNSTISGFIFNGTAVSFNVSGDLGTTGFCRICIPTALMNDSYNVFVNGTEVAYTLLPFSNSTQSYLYFTYSHSIEQVIVVPESPTLTILLLLFTLSALTILSAKKRTRKRLN